MDLKLPVDVHVASGNDGLALVIGGLILPLTAAQLAEVLGAGEPIAQGKRRKEVKPSPAADPLTAWRRAKEKSGLCAWCPKDKPSKALKGRRLCRRHADEAKARIAHARRARKGIKR